MELTPVRTEDAEWLADAVETWDGTVRWDLRARTPSPRLIWRCLWDGVAAQRVVRDGRDQPIALVQTVGLDLHHGVAEVAMLVEPDRAGEIATPLDGFVDLAFRSFPVRKLMFWVPDDASGAAGCIAAIAAPIARIPDHRRRSRSVCVGVTLFEVRRR